MSVQGFAGVFVVVILTASLKSAVATQNESQVPNDLGQVMSDFGIDQVRLPVLQNLKGGIPPPEDCYEIIGKVKDYCFSEVNTSPQYQTRLYIQDLLNGLSPTPPTGIPDPSHCFLNDSRECLGYHLATVDASLGCALLNCLVAQFAASDKPACVAATQQWCPPLLATLSENGAILSEKAENAFKADCTFHTRDACKSKAMASSMLGGLTMVILGAILMFVL